MPILISLFGSRPVNGPRDDVRIAVEGELALPRAARLIHRKVGVERMALEVTLNVGLRPESAAGAPKRPVLLPPFAQAAETCASTAVLSNIWISPALRLHPARAWKKASNVPERDRRENRFQMLFQLPNAAGRTPQAMLWTVKTCGASRDHRLFLPLALRLDRTLRKMSTT